MRNGECFEWAASRRCPRRCVHACSRPSGELEARAGWGGGWAAFAGLRDHGDDGRVSYSSNPPPVILPDWRSQTTSQSLQLLRASAETTTGQRVCRWSAITQAQRPVAESRASQSCRAPAQTVPAENIQK